MPPGPGPALQRGLKLPQRSRVQLESKPGAVTGSADHTGWIISNASVMQKHQLACSQVGEAAMGIEQLLAAIPLQHQGHGIHREIPACQILIEWSRLHHGVLAWCGVALLTGTGEINQQSIQPQLRGAEALMQLQPRHPLNAKPLLETTGQISAGTFQDQIQIRKPCPGGTMTLMEQCIANSTTDQSQAAKPLESSLLDEGQRQLRRDAWKLKA